MPPPVIIIVIVAYIAGIIYYFYRKKKKEKEHAKSATAAESPVYTLTGQQVVDTLDSLGYFKYTDADRLGALKEDIATVYDEHKVLETITSEKPPFDPYCRRFYYCDGETLFELDGIVDYLNSVKPTFDKLSIPLHWQDDYFSADATEHTIIINGKKYMAFEGDPGGPQAWGIATRNFVEILNDQLAIHQSDERVYPILFNNSGRIVFLTSPQYDFIQEHFDKRERPMEVNLWWQTFNV